MATSRDENPRLASNPGLAVNPDLARFMADVQPIPAAVPPAPMAPPAPSPARGSMAPAAAFQAPAAPPAPQPVTQDAAQAQVEATLASRPEDALSKYWEALSEIKVSKDEASRIIDSMLFQGFYEETFKVTSKLAVTFRTRDQKAVDRLNNAMQEQDPKFNASVMNLVQQYNLASSLVRYGPHAFDTASEDGFETSLKYVKKLPFPVFQLLATKLSKFDEKLATIMTEEAVSSFF